jgi:hypothetical protein
MVDENGRINLNGFWGDYELTIDGQTVPLTLSKGDAAYSLVIAPGDFNGDGSVDAADYVVWRSAHGSATDRRADGNGDGNIDNADYDVWQAHFGTTYGENMLGFAAVPEPATVLLLAAGILSVTFCPARREMRNCSNRRRYFDDNGISIVLLPESTSNSRPDVFGSLYISGIRDLATTKLRSPGGTSG